MRLQIVAPALPPRLDGIGDYTACLAAELVQQCDVTILTGVAHEVDPISNVRIVPCFSPTEPASVRGIAQHVRAERPDWLLLQYNPFAYGKWGLNLHLPLVLRSIRREVPQTRIAIMCHEVFTPLIDFKFAVMTTWQRAQLLALGKAADSLFFSLETWTRRFRRWFPRKQLTHLPVGSNIPRVAISSADARDRLGVDPGTVVLGVFGTAHPSRMLPLVRSAAAAAHRSGPAVLVLYVGPDTDAVEAELPGIPLRAEGPLSADEVSKRFAAMDVYLSAFVDGVSTRRGSLMTGLQHGIATVGTRGEWTDSVLGNADGTALLLSPVASDDGFHANVCRLIDDVILRRKVGEAGQRLYDAEFAWSVIAERLLARLGAHASGR